MQYATMIKSGQALGRSVPRALMGRVSEQRMPRSRKRSIETSDAARDDWLQANAGARSQSDFWIQLLVVRNVKRPPL